MSFGMHRAIGLHCVCDQINHLRTTEAVCGVKVSDLNTKAGLRARTLSTLP